jgi:predicted phosphodiesterase
MWNLLRKRNSETTEAAGDERGPDVPPKIFIISDIHGNLEALRALPPGYDELWVLGDLVNYGPQPAEVIDFVREKASLVVRGNHDDALGFDRDPRCSRMFRRSAEEAQRYTASVLSKEQKKYLAELPLFLKTQRANWSFYLCHAIPSDPLYAYCSASSMTWPKECDEAGTDFLCVGHTHVQFFRQEGNRVVVNPGSIGQSKSGSPRATYAVWDNGSVVLHSYAYPVERTVELLKNMPVSREVQDFLIGLLETGVVPKSSTETVHVKNHGA